MECHQNATEQSFLYELQKLLSHYRLHGISIILKEVQKQWYYYQGIFDELKTIKFIQLKLFFKSYFQRVHTKVDN